MKQITIVHLLHIFIIGGFLLYVGFQEENTPVWAFRLLLATGIIVFFYHIYLYYKQGEELATRLFHILLMAPLLVWVGYQQKKTTHEEFRFLVMAGFASVGYHSYAIVRYSK
jgi:hypothetical protein